MGSDISTSLSSLISGWKLTLSRFYVDAIGYVGFAFYIFGIGYSIIKKERQLLLILGSVFIFQLAFMLKGGETFAHHTYYIISFVPAMSIFAAYFVSLIKLKWLKIILILTVVVEGVLNLQHDFMPKPAENYRLKMENVADNYTAQNELIVINNEANPASLYFTHRKGWTVTNSIPSNPDLLKEMKEKGCKLFIWDKHRANKPENLPYFKLIQETEDFAIFQPK
tara:strand:- start:717 stop:1388 length:672 start_codon:yes stop_codon:yes gene_type:complete